MVTTTTRQTPQTRQFILRRDGQPVVYDIVDSRIILRKRRGRHHKYLVDYLPNGVRFVAGYGPATAVEVRRWERANGITPVHRALERVLRNLVDRLLDLAGPRNAVDACLGLLRQRQTAKMSVIR